MELVYTCTSSIHQKLHREHSQMMPELVCWNTEGDRCVSVCQSGGQWVGMSYPSVDDKGQSPRHSSSTWQPRTTR